MILNLSGLLTLRLTEGILQRFGVNGLPMMLCSKKSGVNGFAEQFAAHKTPELAEINFRERQK